MKLCLFVVCALAVAILPQADGRKFYHFVHEAKTWIQAYDRCIRLGLSMATIESASDQATVDTMLEKAREKNTVWIGGTTLLQKDKFIWAGTTREFNYTNWAESEPQNPEPAAKMCVRQSMLEDSRGWLLRGCEAPLFFICEG